MTIKSVSDNQSEILKSIISLHCQSGIDCDISYGNGVFYKEVDKPALAFDIDPQCDGVQQACSTEIPLGKESLKSIVFDPPFLTYVRSRDGNGKMVMAKRFSGYWRYDELEDHYKKTLTECKRLLVKKGILIFKCQDIIHNHKMHCTHANIIQWAEGFRLKDLFVLIAQNRIPSPNRAGTQKHARIHHSYFLVLEKI